MTPPRSLVSLLFLFSAALVLLPACGHHARVRAANTEMAAESIRIVFRDVAGTVWRFRVHNESKEVLVIDRNAVHLKTPSGVLDREPGGAEGDYTVEPGRNHDVFVKFDTGDLAEGSQVQVDWGNAFTLGGRPLHVPPMPFTIIE